MRIRKIKQGAGVTATVIDDLNSDSAIDALSAKQGKMLNEKISNDIDGVKTYCEELINKSITQAIGGEY